ncbi:MAG: hypothetical protein H0V18_20010 [Pyrinomonadaceae bacterium]|nr:hypothetical protein [Pyrinomonadaceae bacterium]
MKKYIVLLSLSLGLVLILIQTVFLTRTASNAGPTPKQPPQKLARLGAHTTVQAVGQGNPLINLRSGRDLLTSYLGSSNAQLILEQNLARPTALASADFDEDGTADLIAGYAGPSGGILTMHRGNVDAIYPNSPEAKQRKAEGSFTESPFLASALVLELPEAPDFVATGDFDADGHWDLAMAANASKSLYLLAGDGRGSFASPKPFELHGRVTAFASGEINRADGLTDIAVAVVAEQGAQVLVFEGPQGALRSESEAFRLPAPATDLVVGRLNEDYLFDLAAAAGPALLVIEGRDRKLSLDAAAQSEVPQAVIKQQSFPFGVSSMSVGNFDGGPHEELALLADDRTLHLLTRAEKDSVEKQVGHVAQWSSKRLSAVAMPGASQLITAKVSTTGRDDLVIADSANNQLHMVTNEIGQQGLIAQVLNVAGGATAVLPMRLNADAMSDLVILKSNQVAPTIVNSPQGPQGSLTVTSTQDGGAGSLRNSITQANQSPGADRIDFNIAPGGAQTITLSSPLPTITEAVTIDATTQPGFAGTPIIQLNGSGVPPGTNGLLITGGSTTVRGLVINRFSGSGDAIEFQTNGGNIVEGNFIGTNLSGNAALANGTGVFINGPPNNRIGGTTVAARNLISDNGRGIFISGLTGINTTGNLVQGNFIGTDAAGTADLGNGFPGLNLFRVAASSIGGTVAGARNIISGNGNSGIGFDTTSGNLVQGNFIGTDVTGSVDLGNSQMGLSTTSGSADTFGGTTPAARNVISGNDIHGILIRGDRNLVQGNFIGTNAQGTAAIGNVLNGVATSDAPNNTIGGATATARNIISGNGQHGISIGLDLESGSTGITVRNNFIGTAVNGSNCLGNFRDGVLVNRGSVSHTIVDNLITCNGRNGVNIPNAGANDPGIRIEVTSNSIFANGALGIDLGDPGITANDLGDPDGGANFQQNFPVLTSFTPTAPGDGSLSLTPGSPEVAITVGATLNSTPNTTFTVNWYFSSDSQCTTNQQGSQPLVTGRVPGLTTGNDGNIAFSFPFDFPAAITNGIINCTATDQQGNTSEFSACLPVTAAPAPNTVQFTSSTANVSETLNATTKVDLNVSRSGTTSGPATVSYASSDGTANDRSDYLAALGTLRFAPGQTSKTISVFIVDDRFGESAETFNVTLSNPVGVSLGAPAVVTVTINSNESVDGPNPVTDPNFSSDFFVRQHYVDFFNREADAPGLAFWKNQIDECTTQACREIRRINVSAAFFVSGEFQQTGYLVYKAYQASFNSGEQLRLPSFLPDTQEIGRGVIFGQPGADDQLEINKQIFFLDFVQRPAFLAPAAYPTTLTALEFVNKLNGNTFDPLNPGSGPALTPSQRDALVTQLSPNPSSPTLRAQVLRSVSENGLFSQRQFNKAFVLMQYFGYLRRNPDAPPDTNFDGYNFWLAKLNQFNGNFVDAEMVKAFITSGEYRQRFGP